MIYSQQQVRSDYAKLTKFLIQKQLSISTMESATSGQIASLITDTPGASAILKGAFITYSNEAKIKQGVNADIINTYSVYSEQTALAMAHSCKTCYSSDLGIGITGTMGNLDLQNPHASQLGKVYLGIIFKQESFAYTLNIEPQPDRLSYKLAVAQELYNRLAQILSIQH